MKKLFEPFMFLCMKTDKYIQESVLIMFVSLSYDRQVQRSQMNL